MPLPPFLKLKVFRFFRGKTLAEKEQERLGDLFLKELQKKGKPKTPDDIYTYEKFLEEKKLKPKAQIKPEVARVQEKKEIVQKSRLEAPKAVNDLSVEDAAKRTGIEKEMFEGLKRAAQQAIPKITNLEVAELHNEYNTLLKEGKMSISFSAFAAANISVARQRLKQIK